MNVTYDELLEVLSFGGIDSVIQDAFCESCESQKYKIMNVLDSSTVITFANAHQTLIERFSVPEMIEIGSRIYELVIAVVGTGNPE